MKIPLWAIAAAMTLPGCGGCGELPVPGNQPAPANVARPVERSPDVANSPERRDLIGSPVNNPAPGQSSNTVEDLFAQIQKVAANDEAMLRHLEGPLNAEKLRAIGWTVEQVSRDGYVPEDYDIRYDGRALTITRAPKGPKGGMAIRRAIR